MDLCFCLLPYASFDLTPLAVLCFTCTGAEARRVERELRTTEQVAAELCAALRVACPGVEVPPPSHVRVTRWSEDPLFCGAYSLLPVGCPMDVFDSLSRPVGDGRVWFAGEACHARYSGFLHGALLSGEEAAARLADELLSAASLITDA